MYVSLQFLFILVGLFYFTLMSINEIKKYKTQKEMDRVMNEKLERIIKNSSEALNEHLKNHIQNELTKEKIADVLYKRAKKKNNLINLNKEVD